MQDIETMEERVSMLRSVFKGRSDAYGIERQNGGECVKSNLGDAVIQNHIQGIIRVGVYCLSPSIMSGEGVYWSVVDIDHENLLQAVELTVRLYSLGVASYIEKSKSKGFHVWVFFNNSITAAKARALMLYAVDSNKYEVFPKQCRLRDGDYGNYIYMPLNGESIRVDKTVFLDPNEAYNPYRSQWELLATIEKVDPAKIDELIDNGEFELTTSNQEPVINYRQNDYAELLRGATKGNRTDTLCSLVGHWIRKGISENESVQMAFNWDKNNPYGSLEQDYGPGKVEYTIRDLYKRYSKQAPIETEKGPIENTLAAEIKKQKEKTEEARQKIISIRKDPEIKGKNPRISEVVHDDLLKHGNFIKNQAGLFYFLKCRKTLMRLDSMAFIALLNDFYSLVESEADYRYVFADIKSKCFNYGTEMEVHRFAYYDRIEYKLYVSKGGGQVYVLDGGKITIEDNGINKVLFEFDDTLEGFEIIEPKNDGMLDSLLFNRINFVKDGDTNLSPQEQRLILQTWLWYIFFESIAATKPLMLFLGVKGSGKTMNAKMIGQILFGQQFGVSSVTDDQRDFDALISNRYLIAIDNADTHKAWLCDRLAKSATGQAIEVRRLYATNELARFLPHCFLVLTARTPKFREDDIADRLLILKVDRIENFVSERLILDDIREHRNELLWELFQQLNKCIQQLKENSDMKYTGNFRMADYADFGYKIYGAGGAFMDVLTKMDKEQDEFVMEEDSLLELLGVWLDNPGNNGMEVGAGELFSKLKEIANNGGMDFWYKSSRSLGMTLIHREKNLKRFINFEIIKRPGRPNQYRFEKKDEDNKM